MSYPSSYNTGSYNSCSNYTGSYNSCSNYTCTNPGSNLYFLKI